MTPIYLIGPTTGAARTSQEHMARNVEMICGYHRCTQEEYLQRMREIRALDLPPEPTKKERTASDPAGTTPAAPPATPLADCQQVRQQKEPL